MSVRRTATPRVHRCDVCGRQFGWHAEASAFGSLGHRDIGEREFVTCSAACTDASPSAADLEYIVGMFRPSGFVVNSHWPEWDTRTGRFAGAEVPA
jgi:ABC-type transport system substrate-binding protein